MVEMVVVEELMKMLGVVLVEFEVMQHEFIPYYMYYSEMNPIKLCIVCHGTISLIHLFSQTYMVLMGIVVRSFDIMMHIKMI